MRNQQRRTMLGDVVVVVVAWEAAACRIGKRRRLGKRHWRLGKRRRLHNVRWTTTMRWDEPWQHTNSMNVSHAKAYVKRSVLFAASFILIALHPSYVASSLIEGYQDISTGLEWIRTWALHVAKTDPDT
ncbi:hypothetical protein GUJ93_ZPchr0010g8752 [Zizania palustris]|uniref:Uncharacterized protein n=1 Tax=Zizania palustris TaxID=103762 RepID=A0A8J5WGM1_ZIZPA|nr:hypothetical protein GUJ93_ZPchr0010g8752 [Zizania palustris]